MPLHKFIEIKPKFSIRPYFSELDEHLVRRYLSQEKRLALVETIERKLVDMQYQKQWSSQMATIIPAPNKLSGVRGPVSVDRVSDFYNERGFIPLPFPYLLGCMEKAPIQIVNALISAYTLESIEGEDDLLFKTPTHSALRQLCIKRSGAKLVISLSDYIINRMIRADSMISDKSVMFLATTLERPVESEKEKDLENMMIG